MREREISQKDLTGIGEINALLGRGTRFDGKLAFEGRVRIDGHFRGEIFSDDVLILGEGAEVEAEIEVGTLIVRGGMLRGRVRATRLIEIYPPGRVHGELHAPQIFIDKGVHFEGSCHMEDGDEPLGEMRAADGRPSLVPGAGQEANGRGGAGQPARGAEGGPSSEGKANGTPIDPERDEHLLGSGLEI